MTKNRTPTPVYLDPGMHPGLEVKGLISIVLIKVRRLHLVIKKCNDTMVTKMYIMLYYVTLKIDRSTGCPS